MGSKWTARGKPSANHRLVSGGAGAFVGFIGGFLAGFLRAQRGLAERDRRSRRIIDTLHDKLKEAATSGAFDDEADR